MPNIGPAELILILVVLLLVVGPGKLPDVGAALGKTIREFRKASSEVQESIRVDQPAAAAQPAAAPAASATPAPNTLGEMGQPNTVATPPTNAGQGSQPSA